MNLQRAVEFLGKAKKRIGWSLTALEEMNRFADEWNHSEVERVFSALLTEFTTIHDALDCAARLLDLNDWAKELDNTRAKDRLLFWLWKARDTEIHDVLSKWTASMALESITIVDQAKANQIAGYGPPPAHVARLALFLYEARDRDHLIELVKANAKPSRERQALCGVELQQSRTLALESFSTRDKKKTVTVKRPDRHLGQTVAPSAREVTHAAINFYDLKLTELRAEARMRGASLE